MTNNTEKFIDNEIKEELEITSHAVVSVLFHELKQQILLLLIQKEMTIIEISKTLDNLNPGTVKRHLSDLEANNLIILSKELKNEYGINMKYYRSVAKKFKVNLSFP